jgi:hypothetical protein
MRATRVSVPIRTTVALAVAALTVSGLLAIASTAGAVPSANPHPHPSKSVSPSATASATTAPKHSKLDPTKLSISNKVIAHGKHHGTAINGVLTSDGTGLANETVTLESRSGVSPRWTVVATGTTATGGTVSFTVTGKVKTQFELVFAGDATHKGSHSNVITLRPVK